MAPTREILKNPAAAALDRRKDGKKTDNKRGLTKVSPEKHEARQAEGSEDDTAEHGANKDYTIWAVFRDLTTRHYPTLARRRGAE